MTDSRTPTGPSPLEFPERPVDVSQDRIQVLEPHQTARAVPMQPRGLAIGRAPDNDIVLDYPEVSEHHARIEFDGTHYLVLDLNSTNGTYLADARLPAGVPVIWPAATGLRIGEVWLHVLRANAEAAEPADTEAQAPPQIKGSAIDPDLVHFSPAKRIGLFTELSQLSIAPGKSVTLSIVVLNLGATADHVTLSVTGIPANWLAAPAPTLHLLPNTQQEVKLTLHPPGSPQSHAGRYPVTIQVASHSAPSEVAETKLTLTVLAVSAFTSDLRPQSIPANEMAQVTIQNQGNTQETFALTWEDPANELAFDLPPNQIPIAEGQTAVAEFRAAPRVRRIIGGEQAYPFTVLVSSPSGETQTHTGEVVSSAMIPAWLPPLLLVMCLLLGAAAALIYSDYNSRLASATQAALANQTAVVLAADPDGDRLSNADESRLGTDPLKPDSDGDGLPDGDEITWGTNPLVADTDGDTIPDGREVLELRTSPVNPDTDGDGLLDNVDPDPGNLPTPTPTFTDTPLPSATPLPPTLTFTPLPPTLTFTPLPPTLTFTPVPETATLVPPTLTSTPPPSATLPPPVTIAGLIAFESKRDGNSEIYLMKPDGSGVIRLTNAPNDDTGLAWSPTGARIAFESRRDGNPEIYMMNADGSGQARLTNNTASDTNPAWSPDGSRIAFVSERDGNPEFYVMNADGSAQTRLTNNSANDCCLAWSPDGARLAFASDRDGAPGIYLTNADGSGQTRLTPALLLRPAWSPDGARIAFISDRDGNQEIYVMNADGTGQARLTNSPGVDSNPLWAPGGARLAFISDRDGNAEIYLMNADGSGQIRLTNNASTDCCLVWSPDGARIAFASDRDGNYEVYVMNADGSAQSRVTNSADYDAPAAWRP